MIKNFVVAALLGIPAIAFFNGSSFAGDLSAGRAKVEIACQTCHGLDGTATGATIANLSGQQRDYMIIQLEAYRSGQRQHTQMSIIAQSLSDEDIENVSEWYASVKVTVQPPE